MSKNIRNFIKKTLLDPFNKVNNTSIAIFKTSTMSIPFLSFSVGTLIVKKNNTKTVTTLATLLT